MHAVKSRCRIASVLSAAGLGVAVATLALPSAAAAKDIHLALPSELRQEVEDLKVTRRRALVLPARPVDHYLKFGGYEVMQYRAGWHERTQRAVGSGALAVFQEKSWRKFSFELQNPEGGRLPVDCIQRSESRGLKITRGSSETELDQPWHQELRCSFSSASGASRDLVVSFGRGALSDDRGEILAVEASHRVEGMRFDLVTPVGFLFHRGERAVGAVEILHKGRFVFASSLAANERLDLMASSIALLLADSME